MKLNHIVARRPHKVIYRDGDLAIKLFDKHFSKADVLNEALNQARIEETDLHIPKIHEVTKIDDCWALVYDFIEGKTLAELTTENPEKTREYTDLMIGLQMQVHAQRCPLLPRLRDKMMRKIAETKFNATTRYELQTQLEGMPKHDKVCHGDFNPGNIILTESGTPFIIDWSHATQGNASADAARTYLLYLLQGRHELGEYYLRQFSLRSDIPRQNIEKWIPIVAASQSVKGNPEEIEFLSRLVDVVDYE